LDFVSITLDRENPYKIFSSLNSTGVDLAESDLIRNHVFMELQPDEQDAFDDGPWHDLEQHFIDKTTGEVQSTEFADFFREAMMRKGGNIPKNSIFVQFEKSHKSGGFKPRDVLSEFQKQARSYDIIRGTPHPSPIVERDLARLRVLKTKSAYPLVLRLFELHQEESLHETDLASALRAISGFVLRRAITGATTRFYGQWFCAACRELGDAPLANLRKFLRDKGWPTDADVTSAFVKVNLYSNIYARAILEGIEREQQHESEPVDLAGCSVEHVLPQAIIGDDADGNFWRTSLGENWKAAHEAVLHSPGNLTLVGADYNALMQNRDFVHKKRALMKSKVSLNDYFQSPELARWDQDTIRTRALKMAEVVCQVWIGP
jgi:hypothetical protein